MFRMSQGGIRVELWQMTACPGKHFYSHPCADKLYGSRNRRSIVVSPDLLLDKAHSAALFRV
jgi:hypothetical protein